jgi:hypothetical protein
MLLAQTELGEHDPAGSAAARRKLVGVIFLFGIAKVADVADPEHDDAEGVKIALEGALFVGRPVQSDVGIDEPGPRGVGKPGHHKEGGKGWSNVCIWGQKGWVWQWIGYGGTNWGVFTRCDVVGTWSREYQLSSNSYYYYSPYR